MPIESAEPYQRARGRVRRQPSWMLRRRERRILARRWPATGELAELAALRRELRLRAVGHPARSGWWPW